MYGAYVVEEEKDKQIHNTFDISQEKLEKKIHQEMGRQSERGCCVT